MKKYTKKFFKGGVGEEPSFDNIEYNAKEAKKNIGLPKKLWMELSEKFAESKLKEELENVNTCFMAGVVIGWVERGNLKLKNKK